VTSQPITDMEMQTHTVESPGATITYDLRGDLTDATPERPVRCARDARATVEAGRRARYPT
jgi:hypothetical protein